MPPMWCSPSKLKHWLSFISGAMVLLPHCLPSLLPDGILSTPTSATTFQLQSFLKK